MISSRIEMNGVWYLSAERAGALLGTAAQDMAGREDFQQKGRYINYDGIRFYSEVFCQQLTAPKPPD